MTGMLVSTNVLKLWPTPRRAMSVYCTVGRTEGRSPTACGWTRCCRPHGHWSRRGAAAGAPFRPLGTQSTARTHTRTPVAMHLSLSFRQRRRRHRALTDIHPHTCIHRWAHTYRLFKLQGLVHLPREAVNEEARALARGHGVLEEANGDLHRHDAALRATETAVGGP
jgi:hypothetical protein